ncbi:MAG: FliM/FliN family flagellar motor switch protein [Deltaproteobacteria bacterium]|nr:FliM/FliN family flagellar motor switch protein [Deltaproteobacteria bacterium]
MAKKLRKYRLHDLPRLTRTQVQATNALLCHLPQTPFEHDVKARVRELLARLVHADVDIWFEGTRPLEQGELKRVLSEPTCAAIIGMPPRTDKALLEVDLAIAQMAIDKLLGGTAEEVDGQRPLSEIEDGIFSFILLKVLQVVAPDLEEAQLGVRLEAMHGTLASLKERFPTSDPCLVLSFKLFFNQKVGFARLYLPMALMQEALTDAPAAPGPARERALARMIERLDVIRLVMAPLHVEVGRIALPVADVEALDTEDIILVEESELRLEQGDPPVLTGRAQCRVGDGAHGVLTGTLVVGERGRYEVQLEAIAPVGEPRARGHLFLGGPRAGEGEAEMGTENAKALSAPGIVDEHGRSVRARRAAATRALVGTTGPLAHGGDDREPGAEHSDSQEGQGDDQGDDEASHAATGLLDDVSVALVVELGRVSVSAADVVQLRPGHVIELSRKPGDAVDLVVDGKRIGKGELVEVDGELGVRILSLAR